MAADPSTLSPDQLLAHAGWLRGLARGLVGPAAADDLVQDTLIAALDSPPAAGRSPRPWLKAVLRNRARMGARAGARRAARESQAPAAVPAEPDRPDQLLGKLETQRLLCELVSVLDEPFRSTIVLRYFEGLEPSEIARREGIPAGTVRWRLSRAMTLLREALDRRAGGDRRAWLGAVAPLAAAPAGAAGAGAASTSSALHGVLLMKIIGKLSLALVVVALATTAAILLHHPGSGAKAAGPGPAAVAGAPPRVRITLGESHRAPASPGAAEDAELPIGVVPPGADAHLAGVVRDGGGGTVPAPLIIARDLRGHLVAARGGADGRYALALPHGAYRVTARADGYAAATRVVEVSGQDRLDFYLNPAAAITGLVTRADTGAPAAGAVITAAGDDDTPHRTTAGPDGRFRIADLRPAVYQVTASDDRRAAAARVVVQLGDEQTVDLALTEPGGAIRGRVIAGQGGPAVPGATLEVDDGHVHRGAVTDQAGAFGVEGLLPGSYRVSVSHGRFVRAERTVIVAGGPAPPLTIALRDGGMVRGRVLGADGAPVAGAVVRSSAWALRDPRLAGVHTDARGAFELGPLPPGRAQLSAYHPDRGISEIVDATVPAGGAAEVTLRFGSTAQIAGRVRDDRGAPVAGAAVEVTGAEANASWTTATGPGGRFQVRSLPAGRYRVRASPPGAVSAQAVYDPASSRTIDLVAGRHETVDLVVPGGSETVSGRVVDPAGAPVAGAAVWAERATGTLMSGADPADAPVYSESDGRFELTGLPRGTYTVYAHAALAGEGKAGPIAAGANGVRVSLTASATITATVLRADGRPATDVELTWSWVTREKAGVGMVSRKDSRVLSDPDGHFSIAPVEPSDKVWLHAATPDGQEGGTDQPLSLAPGQTQTLTLRLTELGTVRGRLVDEASGRPLVGVVVRLGRARVPVDGDGRFEVQVPAGHYDRLYLQDGREGMPAQAVRTFDLSGGQVTDLGDIAIHGGT